MKISPKAEYLISKLNENGHSAYIVGGCVRDLLMDKTPGDWDITTSAKPDEIMQTFSDLTVIPTGIKHGTVTVIYKGEAFEVTTFRCDGDYSDHRRPDEVKFVSNLNEDLARRDFKMNAIAYNPNEGLIDPFEGMQDIAYKTISAVGEAEVRFEEDALRILRALRFSSVLNFGIEVKTFVAACNTAHTLKNIATERITAEFLKLICGVSAGRVLQDSEEILKVIFDEPINTEGVDEMPKDEVSRLCVVFKNSPDNLGALRLPRKVQSRVLNVLNYEFKNMRYLVRDLGEDARIYLYLNGTEDMEEYEAVKNMSFGIDSLEISGRDLIELGIQGGKIGEILNALSDELCEDKMKNEHNMLVARVKEIMR